MPNGKVHDHPLTDLLAHGLHPFPATIEVLVLRLQALDPRAIHRDDIFLAALDWEKGKGIAEGEALLEEAIARAEEDRA